MENCAQKRPLESEDTNTPASKRVKKSIPRILDGKFFVIEKNHDEKIDARCIECRKVIKGSLTSTGNFKKHYKKVHPALNSKLEEHLISKEDHLNISLKTQTLRQFTTTIKPEKVTI